MKLIVGIDEAGRGPLAGDVFAAAVVLPEDWVIEGLRDSKKLSAKKREILKDIIEKESLYYAVASASVQEIDRLNILQATMLAMRRAYMALGIQADQILIDGNRIPQNLGAPCEAVVKGDQTHPCIMAASILAKTARDAHMMQLHQKYPEYAFNQHKGYGTALHLKKLDEYGCLPEHRKSFSPIASRIGKLL